MRSHPSCWTKTLTKLGFKRKVKKTKRVMARRGSFEPLEKRELLSVNQLVAFEVAQPKYEVGHFSLSNLDWTGLDRQDDQLTATANGLGVSSSANDANPDRFDPGEQWMFQFDHEGQLMGIQFDEFTAEDADRALLIVGTQEPITITAKEVGAGFWRASRPIKFNVGETLRLEAIAPSEAEIKAALAARVASNADRIAEGLEPIEYTDAPAGAWQVEGLQVLGQDEDTEGGFLTLMQPKQEDSPFSPGGDLLAQFAMTPPPPDPVTITSFESPSSSQQLQVSYTVGGTATDVTINIYRSDDLNNPIHSIPNNNLTGDTVSFDLDPGFTDTKEDYYLVAKVIATDGIDTAEDSQNFEGGVFLHNNILHVQTANTSIGDSVFIDDDPTGTNYDIDWGTYSQSIAISSVNEIHVRTHGGNDTIKISDNSLDVPLWAFGGSGNDNLYGGAGNDYFDGSGGRDTVYGYDGIDEIHGGDEQQGYGYGGDYLYGKNGDDTIYGDGGADYILGGNGNDTIEGGDEDPSYYGTDPHGPDPWSAGGLGGGGYYDGGSGDWIDGGSDNDTIDGGAGNDFVAGYGGNDILSGGADDDYVVGGAPTTAIGSGRDVLYGNAGNDLLKGGDDNDQIYGGAGKDKLYGEAGNDTLDGAPSLINFYQHTLHRFDLGQDKTPDNNAILDDGRTLHLWGNTWKAIQVDYTVTANTVLEFDFFSPTTAGGEGEVHGIGLDPNLVASGSLTFQIHGEHSSWGIQTYNNYDPANGTTHYSIPLASGIGTGLFKYLVFVNDDDTNPTGESKFSNVRLYELGDDDDLLSGGTGDDHLSGSIGSDNLLGGDDDDTYHLDNQADATFTINDTNGNDTFDLSENWTGPSGAILDLSREATTDPQNGAPIYDPQTIFNDTSTGNSVVVQLGPDADVENIVGTQFGDAFTGNALDNVLDGRGGDDTLKGKTGDDTYAFSGEEDLGTDTIEEAVGEGSDTLDFTNLLFGAGVDVDLRNNTGIQQYINHESKTASVDWSQAPELENVTGTYFEDILHGDNSANILDGIFADDEIYGEGGNDTLRGGFGADLLIGGTGNDSLYGSYGDDTYRFNDAVDMGTDSVFEELGEGTDELDFGGLDVALDIDLTNAGSAEEVAIGRLFLEPLTGMEIENVTGTAQGDQITGNEFNNVLEGGDGDDTLSGGDGNDVINGGDGSDTGEGGSGNDESDFGNDDTAPPELESIPPIQVRKGLSHAQRILIDDISSPGTPYTGGQIEIFASDGISAPPTGIGLVDDILIVSNSMSPGSYQALIKVTSSNNLTDTQVFDLEVVEYNANDPSLVTNGIWLDDDPTLHPIFGQGLILVRYWDEKMNINFDASDAETPDSELSYSIIEGPGSIDQSGLYTLNLGSVAGTSRNLTVQVTDMAVGSDETVRTATYHTVVVVEGEVEGADDDGWFDFLDILPVEPPRVFDRTFSTNVDMSVSGTACTTGLPLPNCLNQVNGEYYLTSGPSHGSLTGGLDLSTGDFTYVPDPGFRGIDSFSYDGSASPAYWQDANVPDRLPSNEATVTIVVGPSGDVDIDTQVVDEDESQSPGQHINIASNGEESELFEVSLSAWLREDQHVNDNAVWLSASHPFSNPVIRIWDTASKDNELVSFSGGTSSQWKFTDLPESVFIEGVGQEPVHLTLLMTNGVSDTVLLNPFTFDVDIDSDNNDGFAIPEGSKWEEELEDNEYGLGKLVIQSYGTDDPGEEAQSFTPVVLSLPKGLDPNDPDLEIRIEFDPTGSAGYIDLYTDNKTAIDPLVDAQGIPLNGPIPGADAGGPKVYPDTTYSLSDLNYCATCGNIVLWIAARHEVDLRKTLNGVGEQTLTGSDNYGKPDERITATLVVEGQDVDSDEVKYLVVQPDSFFYHLWDRPEVRSGLAASGAYSLIDLPNFGLKELSEDDLTDLGITNTDIIDNLTGNPTAAGLKAILYQDYVAGGEDEYILAFAGTEGFSMDDWAANIAQGSIIFDNEGVQYGKAMQIASELAQVPTFTLGTLTTTGHSLGGGLASAAAVVADIPAYTFNSAGVNINTLLDDGDERYPGSELTYLRETGSNAEIKKIQAYYVDWDILSFFQDNVHLLGNVGKSLRAAGVTEAMGVRHKMDGPYDSEIVFNVELAVIATTINPWLGIASFLLTTAEDMGKAHLRPSYLYGLLSDTNTSSGDDIFGYEL